MRPYDTNSPRTYTHDCDRCRFLGWTIGGGRLTDLYVHESGLGTPVTLIARYGNLGFDYYSCPAGYARAVGHAELWVAQELLDKEKANGKAPGNHH